MEIHKTKLEPHKEYYTQDGYLVEFIGLSDGDIVVRHVTEDQDEERVGYSNPTVTNKLFDEPPSLIREQKIQELDKSINDKQQAVRQWSDDAGLTSKYDQTLVGQVFDGVGQMASQMALTYVLGGAGLGRTATNMVATGMMSFTELLL